MNRRRILLIGGSGFIGKSLYKNLINKGFSPIVVDLVKPKIEGFEVEYYSADVRNVADKFPDLLESAEVVYLLAWTTKPQSANSDPIYDLDSNVISGLHLLDGILRLKNKPRLIFVSTGGAIYGEVKHQPITEDTIPFPIGAYGIGKWTFEQYLMLYHRLYSLDYLVYRPGNPYGKYQDIYSSQGVIAVFLGKIFNGETIQIWGNGEVIRDYLYIDDLSDALSLGVDYRPKDSGLRIFNVGSGKGVSIIDLLGLMDQVCDMPIYTKFLDARKVDVPKIALDCSNSKKYLNWKPKIPLELGLKKTWQWVQSKKD